MSIRINDVINIVSQKVTSKKLLSKTLYQDIKCFSNTVFDYIPQNAKTFSRVKIGKENDSSYIQEIISFFDKDKNIISRRITETGKDDIFVEYSAWQTIENLFGTQNTKKRTIKRIAISKNKAVPDIKNEVVQGPYTGFKFNLTKDYLPIPALPQNNKHAKILSEELQYVKDSTLRFELSKIRENTPHELETYIIKRKYKNSPEIPSEINIHSYSSSYPNLYDLNPTVHTTSLNLYLKKEAKDIKLVDISGNNFDIIEQLHNNPFSQYIYLRPEVKAKYYTRFFSKRRGILPLNIKTYVNSKDVSENAAAHFNPFNGEIHYGNYKYLKPSIAAHEVEHGYQHALSGQNQRNVTPYEKNAFNLLGPCPKEKSSEVQIYEQAFDNYPKNLDKIENLREYLPYWLNDAEVGARKMEQQYKQFDIYPFSKIIDETGF